MNNPLSGTDPTGYLAKIRDPDELEKSKVTSEAPTGSKIKSNVVVSGSKNGVNVSQTYDKSGNLVSQSVSGKNNGGGGGQGTTTQSLQKAMTMSGGRTPEGQAKAQNYIADISKTPGPMGGWMATPPRDVYDEVMGVYPCQSDATRDAGISLIPFAGFAYSFVKGDATDIDKTAAGLNTASYATDKVADQMNAKSAEKISTMRTSIVYGKSKQSAVAIEQSKMIARNDGAKLLGSAGKIFGFAGIGFTAYELKQKLDACPK